MMTPTELMWALVQMLVIAGLMAWATRQAMDPNRRVFIWRTGLFIMAVIPWLQPHMALIKLPWLPVGTNPPMVVPDIGPQASALPVVMAAESGFGFSALLIIWLAGCALLLAPWSRRLLQLHKLSLQATTVSRTSWLSAADHCQLLLKLNRRPILKVTDRFTSPCTWGFFRPVILLPAQIKNSDTLRIVLLHEMAHIKRHDWLWMTLTDVITRLCWFNPFLWWIRGQLNQCFEAACDDMVLQQSIKPSDYAQTLLHFHQLSQPHYRMAVMMAEHSALYHRLQSILNPPTRRFLMNPNKQLMITASVATLMALTGFTQLTQAHPEADGSVHSPRAVSAPAPVPAPYPQATVHPERPAVPASPAEPQAELRFPEPPAVHNHPVAPTPPAALHPETPAAELHEHQLHEARERLQEQEQRLHLINQQVREQATEQRQLSQQALKQTELRLHAEQQRASEARQQALKAAEEQQRISERQLAVAAEQNRRAAEQALDKQQHKLDAEQKELRRQQEQLQRTLDHAEQRSAQQ